MTGTLETVDGRPALRFERRLEHPVERVWRAITDPDELDRWFLAAPRWTLEAGATFGVEGLGGSGRIVAVQPPRRLVYEWDGEAFHFELRAEGDGCLLVFTHVFDDRVLGAQHAPGWEAYLARLDAHLAGRHLPEADAHAAAKAFQDDYAERFDLDRQVARRMFGAEQQVTLEDGPLLRLERHFDHAPERVWRAITDPQELRQWFPADAPLEVADSDPPRRLEGTWFGDCLRFELHPEGDGCRLVFTHAFAERDTAARTGAGWDRCFARLDALLIGRPMSERASLQLWPMVHEHYAARWEVDPALGRDTFAAR